MTKEELIATLDQFTIGYLECALWSSTDDTGRPLDDRYEIQHLTRKALVECMNDCRDFQAEQADVLAQAGSPARNGHDFWLTRNRHGAGFWDRGYSRDVSDTLTTASHVYGSVDLRAYKGRVYL